MSFPFWALKQKVLQVSLRLCFTRCAYCFLKDFVHLLPPLIGWVLDILKEFKVPCFKIFAFWGGDAFNTFKVKMIWKITSIKIVCVQYVVYMKLLFFIYAFIHCFMDFFLSDITSWDLHKNVTSFVLLLKSCFQLKTLEVEWKDLLSFLRRAIQTCWRYPVWNTSEHELETSRELCP